MVLIHRLIFRSLSQMLKNKVPLQPLENREIITLRIMEMSILKASWKKIRLKRKTITILHRLSCKE